MTTQVIFKVDKQLKNRAMRKAKAQGVSFASVLKMATRAFVDGSLAVTLIKQSPAAQKKK